MHHSVKTDHQPHSSSWVTCLSRMVQRPVLFTGGQILIHAQDPKILESLNLKIFKTIGDFSHNRIVRKSYFKYTVELRWPKQNGIIKKNKKIIWPPVDHVTFLEPPNSHIMLLDQAFCPPSVSLLQVKKMSRTRRNSVSPIY